MLEAFYRATACKERPTGPTQLKKSDYSLLLL